MCNFDKYEEDFIPRHRKKSKKSVKKSDHKHEYVPCLILCDTRLSSGTHCSICGKIGDMKYFEMAPCEDRPHVYRFMSQQEILEKYKGLECFNYKTLEKVEIENDEA